MEKLGIEYIFLHDINKIITYTCLDLFLIKKVNFFYKIWSGRENECTNDGQFTLI